MTTDTIRPKSPPRSKRCDRPGPGRRLVLVFQPHRYTRTRDLLDDFANVLASADVLFVTEVYAAGEAPIKGADGRAICRAVRSRGKVEPVFVDKTANIAAALRDVLRADDVVVTMGAGHIGAVAHELACAAEPGTPMNLSITPEFMTRVRWHESMARHTSWRAGGPADMFFLPRDIEDLSAFLRVLPVTVPVYWVGLGSNLLVRDGGIRGVVVATAGAFTRIERRSQSRVYCQASVPCARIARACAELGTGAGGILRRHSGHLWRRARHERRCLRR